MRKSDLSPPRQRFLETCQKLGFGRFEQLPFHGRELTLNPPPCMVRDIMFGKESDFSPKSASDDFELKAQAIEFFQYLDRTGDGVIDVLVVKHGLPFQMEIVVKT